VSYCSMNGITVVVPERALRPREPAPPPPSVTMSAPLVSERFLRPRTKAVHYASSAIDDSKSVYIKQIATLCKQQKGVERRLQRSVESLRSREKALSAEDRKRLQSEIDKLIEMVKQLAAKMNELALAAMKAGASEGEVRAVVGKPPESATVPVIETQQPEVKPDGSIVPGPDAKVIDDKTGEKIGEGDAETQSAAGGIGLFHLAAIGGIAYLLLRRRG